MTDTWEARMAARAARRRAEREATEQKQREDEEQVAAESVALRVEAWVEREASEITSERYGAIVAAHQIACACVGSPFRGAPCYCRLHYMALQRYVERKAQ